MKQTAMQNLKQDLQETINTANNALLEIENKDIRFICQEVVKITLNRIIIRIDDELLEMEKQQIVDGCNQTEFEDIDGMGIHETITKGEKYYNETYKKK